MIYASLDKLVHVRYQPFRQLNCYEFKCSRTLEVAPLVVQSSNKHFETPSKNVFILEGRSKYSVKTLGGAKKKNMAQMDKAQGGQDKKEEGQKEKKGKGKTVAEKRPRGLAAPEVSDPKFVGEVQRMSAITPFAIATQFNLKLSVAKDLLEELERRKLVRLVGGNARIRIYQPAAA